jgi:hypothetical protein
MLAELLLFASCAGDIGHNPTLLSLKIVANSI